MRVEKYKLEVDNKRRVEKFVRNFSFQKGFTLIEMLVVFAIFGVVTVGGVSSFFSYSQNQEFRTTVSDISHTLNFLRSRAMSQVKPSQCGAESLDGYQFLIINSGTAYRSSVRCGGTYHVLETKSLPANVIFDPASTTITFFNVSTGIVDSVKTIRLTSNGKTSTITIETTGVISVQEYER